MKCLIGKDSKKACREFAYFFVFLENVKKSGLPESELCLHIFLIIVKSPQDLSCM
jgi:hypothetical protein